jgi:hypothetical protein
MISVEKRVEKKILIFSFPDAFSSFKATDRQLFLPTGHDMLLLHTNVPFDQLQSTNLAPTKNLKDDICTSAPLSPHQWTHQCLALKLSAFVIQHFLRLLASA